MGLGTILLIAIAAAIVYFMVRVAREGRAEAARAVVPDDPQHADREGHGHGSGGHGCC